MSHILLSNGMKLPTVGLGTYRAQGHDVKQAVKTALNIGIRHIDTASIYKVRRKSLNHSAIYLMLDAASASMTVSVLIPSQNEAEIGAAIKESGVSREDIFITSKVSPYEQGSTKAAAACEGILQRLDCGYLVSIITINH
jgi:diketogulonate reductase-like aldo/keto reductase